MIYLLYIKKRLIFLLLSVFLFLPSLIIVLGKQSSYASGMIISTIIVVLLSIPFKENRRFIIKSLFFLRYQISRSKYFILYLSIPPLFYFKVFDFVKYFSSIFLIIYFFWISIYLSLIIINTKGLLFLKSIRYIVVIIYLLINFFCISNYIPFTKYQNLNHPIFPFMEPSHLALFIAPYFLFIIKFSKSLFIKFFLIFNFVFLLSFYLSNSTFLILIIFSIILNFKLTKVFFIFLSFSLVILLFNLDISYYTNRADIKGSNLTSLVWVQGWEESYINFKKTYGLGIGFQQLGIIEPSGETSQVLFKLFNDEYLNRYDGGTFGAKIISEMGFIGLLIIVLMLFKIIASFKFLKYREKKYSSPQYFFFHSCVFFFLIEIFFRSTSYLSPGLFMFFIGINGLNYSHKKINYVK